MPCYFLSLPLRDLDFDPLFDFVRDFELFDCECVFFEFPEPWIELECLSRNAGMLRSLDLEFDCWHLEFLEFWLDLEWMVLFDLDRDSKF